MIAHWHFTNLNGCNLAPFRKNPERSHEHARAHQLKFRLPPESFTATRYPLKLQWTPPQLPQQQQQEEDCSH